MSESRDNYRMERIERLLDELRYEVQRGMMEGEVDEHICFSFVVPVSRSIPNGAVWCEFRTRPTPSVMIPPDAVADGGKLRIVK